VVLLSVVVFLGLCAAIIIPAVARGQDVPVATETAPVVSSTPSPTATATATSTSTPTPAPTHTPFPTPTLVPPEGVTEIGLYVWNMARDLGFEYTAATLPGANAYNVYGPVLYSDDGKEKKYVSKYFRGFESTDQAEVFLILYEGHSKQDVLRTYGFGFSLYYGSVPLVCQGIDHLDKPDQPVCMKNIESEFAESGKSVHTVDADNLYWIPTIAYPLNEAQIEVLINKYQLKSYPELHKIISIR